MKILLAEWAAKHYTPPPSAHVLRQWVRLGEIHPAPERVGRDLYVEATAIRRAHPCTPAGGGLVAQLTR